MGLVRLRVAMVGYASLTHPTKLRYRNILGAAWPWGQAGSGGRGVRSHSQVLRQLRGTRSSRRGGLGCFGSGARRAFGGGWRGCGRGCAGPGGGCGRARGLRRGVPWRRLRRATLPVGRRSWRPGSRGRRISQPRLVGSARAAAFGGWAARAAGTGAAGTRGTAGGEAGHEALETQPERVRRATSGTMRVQKRGSCRKPWAMSLARLVRMKANSTEKSGR